MSNKFRSVDEYIESFPEEIRGVLTKIRKIIHKVAPQAEDAISYGIPVVKLNGKYLIYFSGWKKHISLYPIPSGDREFKNEIKPYVAGPGTLKFLLSKPIPYKLIEKIVIQSISGNKVRTGNY